jgi:hypothetical protein
MGSPAELAARHAELQLLRDRLGHRYVLAGEQGADPVLHQTMWDMVFAVPLGYVIITFTVPVPISRETGVRHGTHIVRVIDLDEATIVAESFELLRGTEHADFSDEQVREALHSIGLTTN